MSWPLQIIPPGDKVQEIKWRRWFLSFLCVLAVLGIIWGGAKIILPEEGNELLELFFLLYALCLFVFCVLLSVRVYYYGVCLSAFEAREHEAEITKENWTEWASKKFHISTCNLFLPPVVSKIDIASSSFVDIYNEQQLKLRGHNNDAYTEEQLIYELLASVRTTLIRLSKSCVFDVIFTHGRSCITFSTFKECWAAIGLSESCLDNYYFWDGTLGQNFDMLSNIKVGRVSIIISANVEGIEKYYPDATEFASILVVTNQEKILEKECSGMALRPMTCSKALTKQEFDYMITYQPDVLRSSRVLFSNMNVDDVRGVSDVLRTSCLSMNVGWEYETQHLDLMLGKLGDIHFWLVFVLAFFISAKNKEPILMIASVGNDYVFNVVKPSDNGREH